MSSGFQVRRVALGAAAAALGEEVAALQATDPLAAATVVVPRGSVGLATRRLLASGDLDHSVPSAPTQSGRHGAEPPGPGRCGSGRPGLVNVQFVTAARLAADLGLIRCAAGGRTPMTTASIAAALQSALRQGRWPLLAPVRNHPATLRSLATAFVDLRSVSPSIRASLARQSQRAAEVVGLCEAATSALTGCYHPDDLPAAAVEELESSAGQALEALGAIIVYLPWILSAGEERLVQAISRYRAVTVLLGLTGDHQADELTEGLVRRLVGRSDREQGPSSRPFVNSSVLSAPNADAEVRLAARGVMERLRQGGRPERMAIVHPPLGPYDRLIREVLDEAGIRWNGDSIRPLSATVTGRALLGAFELADRGWRRTDLEAWIGGLPIRHRGLLVPSTEWRDAAREAGIVGGIEQWVDRLDRHAAALRRDPAAEAGSKVRHSQELAAFVTALAARFESLPDRWATWTTWARQLLTDYLGDPTVPVMTHRPQPDEPDQPDRPLPLDVAEPWPAEEVEAHTVVLEMFEELARLDGVHPGPDQASFRAILAVALSAPAPHVSRRGQGVFVGSVGELVGQDLDVAFILGMTDGAFPMPQRDDPLLPDHERVAAGSESWRRRGSAAEGYRDYAAALVSCREVVLSFPRGDQRQGRELRPSRWLLDELTMLSAHQGASANGHRLASDDLSTLPAFPGWTMVPSFTAAIRAPGEPVSVADRDVRSLLRFRESEGRLDGHYLVRDDQILGRGVEASRARLSNRFTRFDGLVDRVAVARLTDGTPVSATGLAEYATCPRRYFFSRVLDVRARRDPEDATRLEPVDRGRLVHEVLERFMAAETALPPAERIQPSQQWGPDGVTRMEIVAARVLSQYERAGLTGRPLFWQLDRAALRRDLRRFLLQDDQFRAMHGSVPHAVELRFGAGRSASPVPVPADPGSAGPTSEGLSPAGSASALPVALTLSDGRQITFRGVIDRLDRTADGGYVVVDYKTGSDRDAKALAADPVAGGRLLQLVLYGLAAGAGDGVPVSAWYWFVSRPGTFEPAGFDVGPEQLQRFTEVVEVLVDEAELGRFPARPGAPERQGFAHCHHCDYQSICPLDRARVWARVRGDATLHRYVALVEPEQVIGDSLAPLHEAELPA